MGHCSRCAERFAGGDSCLARALVKQCRGRCHEGLGSRIGNRRHWLRAEMKGKGMVGISLGYRTRSSTAANGCGLRD